jgi:hypothetical protein
LGLEIQRTEEALARVDEQTAQLQAKLDGLRSADPDVAPTPDEDAASRTLLRSIHAGTTLSEKLAVLRQPSELERRINEKLANQQSLRRLLMSEATETTTAPKKPTPADQGVPAVYLSDDGKKFRTGMDARLKSDLIASITGEITAENPGQSLSIFDEATARGILEARGWTGFLERKVALLAEKADKKAKAAEAREVREREAAEKKAAAAAEKEKAKAEAAAAKAAEGGSSSSGSGGKTGGSSKTDQARAQREAKAAAAAG